MMGTDAALILDQLPIGAISLVILDLGTDIMITRMRLVC